MSFRISLCCKLQVERNFTQYKCRQHTPLHIRIFNSHVNCCIPTGALPHLSHNEMQVWRIAAWSDCRHWLGARLYRTIYWHTQCCLLAYSAFVALFARSVVLPTIISSFSHIKVETKIECGVDLMEI